MVFINLETQDTHVYTANSNENGSGVRCYTGHRIIPLFAFAESDCNPNIYVYTYPEYNRICKLAGMLLIMEYVDSIVKVKMEVQFLLSDFLILLKLYLLELMSDLEFSYDQINNFDFLFPPVTSTANRSFIAIPF